MDLFIYSDESGVFDKKHNDIFVYGGVIFLGREERDGYARKFLTAEKAIRCGKYSEHAELKACKITNKEKGKLYRSLNHTVRFGIIIKQRNVLDQIFLNKKDKQRYLDYTYRVGLRQTFKRLINERKIRSNGIEHIYIYNDEHSTATNGRYELREGLEQELKTGTYNLTYTKFSPPVFHKAGNISLQFCNSDTVTLIRAADIVANRTYHAALNENYELIQGMYVSTLPE